MVLLELLVEKTAAVLVEELLKKVLELGRRVTEFKDTAESLEETLRDICPLIQDIDHQSHALKRQPAVLQRLADFRQLMGEGQEFICKCLKVDRWKFWKINRYKKRVEKLDEKLRIFDRYIQHLTLWDTSAMCLAMERIQLFFPDLTKLTLSIV